MSAQSIRRIEDSTPFHGTTAWILAALCLAAAVAVVFVFDLKLDFDVNSPTFNPAVFLPVILAAVGLFQAVKALRARSTGRRFGASVFEMEGERVELGETLRGRVKTSRDLVARDGFAVRLACIETVWISDSPGSKLRSESRREDKVRWSASRKVASAGSAAQGVEVEFAIPSNAMKDAKTDAIRWTLEVEAEVDGARYEALFGVPVVDRSED